LKEEVDAVTASQLGRKILQLLALKPGSEFVLAQTRDGSVLVKSSESDERSTPSQALSSS